MANISGVFNKALGPDPPSVCVSALMIDSAIWRIDVERVRSHFTHLLSGLLLHMCSKVNARRPPQTQGKSAASFCLSLLLHHSIPVSPGGNRMAGLLCRVFGGPERVALL